MTVEISSMDPQMAESLRGIAEADSVNINCLTLKPMEGQEIITLIIENFGALSSGATLLITALKTKVDFIRISKDGVELGKSETKKLLESGKD